jgi:HAD superfamily hydrolase (TIGR01509 family)
MKMPSAGLIIFDCDGVLVDSELIACRTVSICLHEAGINLSVEEVVSSYMGVSVKTMIDDLIARFLARLPPNFPEVLQMRTREAFDHDLKAMEGVKKVLPIITVRTCVASSSARERIIHSLEITGLLEYFDGSVFSATQVAHGKPAPDLFFFAAEQMSVPAKDCLVIEDSIPGVQAARAAGMRVLGFTGGSHCLPGHAHKLQQEGAMATFTRMAELPSLLSNLS